MTDEKLYQVSDSVAVPAEPIDLATAGFKERQHLQEWVLAHPEMLGEDILIITYEFDGWEDRVGKRALNRFDVLGLGPDGRLVLAELKRDAAPKDVHLQAITYAALASKFSTDDVVSQLHRRLLREDPAATQRDAEEMIAGHCEALDDDLLKSPRIVLVAGDFDPLTTTSVDWLVSQGLDITLQRVQAYRTSGGETVITVSRIYPIPVLDQLRVSPGAAKAKAKSARRAINTVSRLVHAEIIPDGTELYLEPDTSVGPEHRRRVRDWLAQNPTAGVAYWRNSTSAPLRWQLDGIEYSPTAIAQTVLHDATGLERTIAGPRWWKDREGRSLSELAGTIPSGQFDWEPLHGVLSQIPEGRWTSYGDLAALVETGAQPLGAHVASCVECENAWRVLGAAGRPSPGFRWHDEGRTDTQTEVLVSEGLTFLHSGQADPAARLTAEELAEMLDAVG